MGSLAGELQTYKAFLATNLCLFAERPDGRLGVFFVAHACSCLLHVGNHLIENLDTHYPGNKILER